MIRTILRTLPGEQWAAAREFRRRLKARLDKEGIEIPYPQRMVHVRPQGAELTMTLRLFNTMTRTVEPLVPVVPGRVTLYTCGPTIWNYAHIGNFRTFVFEDLLRRWLIASGLEVYQVMNLTDVDDRIIGEAGKKGVPIREFTVPLRGGVSRRPEFPADPGRGGISARHRFHRADGAAHRRAAGQGSGVPGRRRFHLFLHRALSRLRPPLAARQA